jgi:cobalt/nickel transport system permease protein
MGVLTALVGYSIYRFAGTVLPDKPSSRTGAAFVAAWISVMLAATLTSIELAISGTSPLDVALPAMLGVHVFIGIGEGLITAAAVALVAGSRPDLLESFGGTATPAEVHA